MEMLLIGVTVASLLLAIAMSVVAWKLLRDARDRSAARVEALEALALPAVPTPAPVDAPRVLAMEAPAAEAHSDWDAALRNSPSHHALDVDVEADAARSARRAARSDTGRVDIAHEDMFGVAPVSGIAGRRWLALAAVTLVMGATVATMYALRSPEIVAAVAASRTSANADAHPLELLSLRHESSGDGSFTVTGLVQNPTEGQSVGRVVAVVYLFDVDGKFFASGRATIEQTTFGPGDEAPFVVHVPNAPAVSRYRVGFRREDGGVIAHVDRRGRLPDGTTGDQIDSGMPPASMAAPISAPRRPEGN